MGTKVSLELRGQRLSSVVTDSDLIFFLGIFFLLPEERDRLQRNGSEEVLKSLAARQQLQLEEAIADELQSRGVSEVTEEVKESATTRNNQAIGEALIHRINFDGYVRVEAAQRFTEIFPDINPNVVYFEDKIDQKGDRTRKGRIRLETEELLNLVLAVLTTEEKVKQEVVVPEAIATPQVDIKKELAEAQPVRSQIVGFEKSASPAKASVIPAAPGTVEVDKLLPFLTDEAKVKLGLV